MSLNLIVELYLISPVCIVGLLGNLITVLVLTRREMRRSSVNPLFICLTVCDSLILCLGLYAHGIYASAVESGGSYLAQNGVRLVPLIAFMTLAAQAGSIYFVLGISVERYVAVCHSLRARTLCTKRRSLILSTVIFIFVIVSGSPAFFPLRAEWVPVPENWTTVRNGTDVYGFWVLVTTEYGQSNFALFYVYVIVPILLFAIPFPLIVIINFRIFSSIKQAERTRLTLTQTQQAENAYTKAIVLVVITTGICYTPILLVHIIELLSTEFGFTSLENIVPYFGAFVELFLMINSATNFIIYCVAGTKFRLTLLRMFGLQHFLGAGSCQLITLNTESTIISKSVSRIG